MRLIITAVTEHDWTGDSGQLYSAERPVADFSKEVSDQERKACVSILWHMQEGDLVAISKVLQEHFSQ